MQSAQVLIYNLKFYESIMYICFKISINYDLIIS